MEVTFELSQERRLVVLLDRGECSELSQPFESRVQFELSPLHELLSLYFLYVGLIFPTGEQKKHTLNSSNIYVSNYLLSIYHLSVYLSVTIF